MPHWRHIKSYLVIQLRTHGAQNVVGTNALLKLLTLTLWSMDDRIPWDKEEMGGPRGSRIFEAASDLNNGGLETISLILRNVNWLKLSGDLNLVWKMEIIFIVLHGHQWINQKFLDGRNLFVQHIIYKDKYTARNDIATSKLQISWCFRLTLKNSLQPFYHERGQSWNCKLQTGAKHGPSSR